MKLEFCFLATLDAGTVVDYHSHHALEIVYYKKGGGEIAFKDRKWDFSENTFHIAPAHIAHRQSNRTAMESICVGVSGSGLETLSGTWNDTAGQLRYPLEELRNELNGKKTACECIAHGLLGQIVGLCRRVIQDSEKSESKLRTKKVDAALHMIRKSEGKISVETLSETLYLSKDYLRYLVKKNTGESPINHIIRARMQKACHLLETSELAVSQIADRCGFNDVYYFSKFFKQHARFSPSAYRRKLFAEKHK